MVCLHFACIALLYPQIIWKLKSVSYMYVKEKSNVYLRIDSNTILGFVNSQRFWQRDNNTLKRWRKQHEMVMRLWEYVSYSTSKKYFQDTCKYSSSECVPWTPTIEYIRSILNFKKIKIPIYHFIIISSVYTSMNSNRTVLLFFIWSKDIVIFKIIFY
jgi:hypothetical protein